MPAAEQVAGDLTTDPRGYFDSLSKAEQDRHFTKAGAEAIREGADIGRVVNARRGMDVAGGRATRARRRTTTELAGRRQRLTPEGIYDIATDRDEAIRLLRRHRYLI